MAARTPSHPDYELAAELLLDRPQRLKALADPLRATILDLVLERAATVSELADALGRPRSSVAYHVDVLVDAGLLKVVRTRKVRAVEERFYGRVARTVVFDDVAAGTPPDFLLEAVAATRDLGPEQMSSTMRHVRISAERAKEFFGRVAELAAEFTELPREGDEVWGFVAAVYRTDQPTLPPAAPGDTDGENDE